MTLRNVISGVTLKEDADNGVYICYIEDFSDELKEEIRKMLSSIWHGSVASAESNQFNYKNTLRRLLERYNTKDDNTKKGMIGELLIHLLMPRYTNLRAVSVMKNKEENSIKKGFDVVYCDERSSIWYCEVKSGGDTNTTEEINTKNKELINNAKSGIEALSLGNRATLWDSVLIDVNLTIFNSDKQIEIKNLLNKHHPDSENRNMDRNVVLSSVLYKSMENKICPSILADHKNSIAAEKIFVGLLIFSIQKPTYKKIADFLTEESNDHE